MSSVYALGDPRTNEIRYIGIAKDVFKRYAAHLNRPHTNDVKNAWMEDVKMAGIVPTLTVLETNLDEAAIYKREAYWIQHYLKLGAPLTNIIVPKEKHKAEKILELLQTHEMPLIKELGSSAFDLLSPARAASEIGVNTSRITDLVRHGWLTYVPNMSAGPAHFYYRWRVEFVKRHKRTNKSKDK
ncbi:MAG: hypothetical protein PVS3B3_24870 [Ktedonobacteraceae bacterium]